MWTCTQQDLGFWVNNTLHHGQVLFKLLLLAILKDPLGSLHYFFNSTTTKKVPYSSSNCVVHNEPICKSDWNIKVFISIMDWIIQRQLTISLNKHIQLFRISQLQSLYSYPVLKKWMNKSFANPTLIIWQGTRLHCWWDERWKIPQIVQQCCLALNEGTKKFLCVTHVAYFWLGPVSNHPKQYYPHSNTLNTTQNTLATLYQCTSNHP